MTQIKMINFKTIFENNYVIDFFSGLIDTAPMTLVTLFVMYFILPTEGVTYDLLNGTLFLEGLILSYGWYQSNNRSLEEFKEWFPTALMGRLIHPQAELSSFYNILDSPSILIMPIINSWKNLDSMDNKKSLPKRLKYFWSRPAYFTGFGLIHSLSYFSASKFIPNLRLASIIGQLLFCDQGGVFFNKKRKKSIYDSSWPGN